MSLRLYRKHYGPSALREVLYVAAIETPLCPTHNPGVPSGVRTASSGGTVSDPRLKVRNEWQETWNPPQSFSRVWRGLNRWARVLSEHAGTVVNNWVQQVRFWWAARFWRRNHAAVPRRWSSDASLRRRWFHPDMLSAPAADCDPDGLFLRQTCKSVGGESQPRACWRLLKLTLVCTFGSVSS